MNGYEVSNVYEVKPVIVLVSETSMTTELKVSNVKPVDPDANVL